MFYLILKVLKFILQFNITKYNNVFLLRAGVAQSAEQLICNQQVAGSIPITSSI